MDDPITVYNEKLAPVGTTFPRRAKQLVQKGRAVWLDGTRAAISLTSHSNVHDEKESIAMTDAYPSNANHTETPPLAVLDTEEKNDLLMLIARKNVRERRAFRFNIIAYAIAWPINLLAFVMFWDMFGIDQDLFFITLGFSFGLLAAWGAWIVRRGYIIWQNRSEKPGCTDPVELEYLRLKDAESRGL